MLNRLTTVDHEILTVLSLECSRTQGYLVDRTGRSRQQIHTRLQILTGQQILRSVHYPTAAYELIHDPRDTDPDSFPAVELKLVNADGDAIGDEWVEINADGIPVSHRYSFYDEDEDDPDSD